MANDLDLTRPNLFVTIPMSKGDNDMNIVDEAVAQDDQAISLRLINWLKEYDQQATRRGTIPRGSRRHRGDQRLGRADHRHRSGTTASNRPRQVPQACHPAPQEIDITYLKSGIAAAENLIEPLH